MKETKKEKQYICIICGKRKNKEEMQKIKTPTLGVCKLCDTTWCEKK